SGVAPRKELEAAQAERDTARVAVERSRAALAAFGSTTAGAVLTPGEAWVMADVLQDDVGRVRSGAAVRFAVDAVTREPLAGRVEAGAAYVSTSTRTGPVRLRVRDPETALRPGMTGTVSIAVGPPRTTVVVPAEAVLQDGAQHIAVLEEQSGHF